MLSFWTLDVSSWGAPLAGWSPRLTGSKVSGTKKRITQLKMASPAPTPRASQSLTSIKAPPMGFDRSSASKKVAVRRK